MKQITNIIWVGLLAASLVGGTVIYMQKEDTKKAYKATQEDAAKLSLQVGKQNGEIKTLQNQLGNLEAVLKKAQKYAETLKKEIDAKDVKIRQLQKKEAETEKELNTLRSEHDVLISDLKDLKRVSERTAQIELELILKERALAQLKKELNELEGTFLKEKRRNEVLKAEISKKSGRIVEFGERIRKSEETIMALERNIMTCKTEIESLEDQLSALRREKTQLETYAEQLQTKHEMLLADSEDKLKAAHAKVTQLDADLVQAKNAYLKYKKANDDLRAQVNQIKDFGIALSKKSTLINRMRHNFEHARAKLRQYGKENQYYRNNVARLKGKLKEMNNKLGLNEDKVTAIQAEHARLFANKCELDRLLEQKEKRIADLEKNLQSARKEIDQLHQVMSEDKEFMKRLKRRQTRLKQEKALREARLGHLKTTYDSLISNLKEEIANKEVTIEKYQKKISVTFVDRILFDFAKASISPDGQAILKRVGQILKGVKERTIRVVGHTDVVPISANLQWKYPSNWELSAARAASVVRYLQNKIGLDPRLMEAVGCAFYEPVASNETEAGRAQNRRVNIIIGPAVQSLLNPSE